MRIKSKTNKGTKFWRKLLVHFLVEESFSNNVDNGNCGNGSSLVREEKLEAANDEVVSSYLKKLRLKPLLT